MSERDSHESYEVFAGRLHWIGALVAASLIGILWLMYGLAHTWLAPLPRIEHVQPPVRPRLQPYPQIELQAVRTREREALRQYQWVDQSHGIARIPIERAMEIIANTRPSVPAHDNNTQAPKSEPEPTQTPTQTGTAQAPARHPGPPPADLDRRAGITQRIGQALPGNLLFHDTHGRELRLAKLDHGKPLVLAFGYFGCPNLCDTQLHSMARTVAALPLQVGKDYEVAFVSIDPAEKPAAAADAANKLARELPRSKAEEWHLLTGDAPDISALASAVGVRYWLDPKLGQYVHPAGLIITTDGARVAQYFFGVSYPFDAVRLALVAASHGHLGTVIDQLVLLCCGYDPTTGRYSLLIGRVTLIVCSAFLAVLFAWLWHLKRRSARL